MENAANEECLGLDSFSRDGEVQDDDMIDLLHGIGSDGDCSLGNLDCSPKERAHMNKTR